MTRLRVVLLCQLAFFIGWAAFLMDSHRDASIVWLETLPVDPRDLFSGQYVQLSYPIELPDSFGCHLSGSMYVKLISSGTVQTQGGPVVVYKAVDCSKKAGPDGLWVKAKKSQWRLEYGIGRFYVNERNALLKENSSNLVAKVSVSKSGVMRVVELVHRERAKPLPVPLAEP